MRKIETIVEKAEFNYRTINRHTERINELEDGQQRQEKINDLAAEVFKNGAVAFDQVEKEIRFLKKLAAGLILIAGGLTVGLLKSKMQILEIIKTMNEG